VGSAGGTASLISYPALLAVGIPALSANVTNSLAFVASLPGSALGSRPELSGQGRRLLRLAPLAVAGGGAGAVLLLVTPATVFVRIVPFLVAVAALALLHGRRSAPVKADCCRLAGCSRCGSTTATGVLAQA
jgi:uncharacterized membrane protein YfcA